MSSRRSRPINLRAPYLKRVWIDPARITDRESYPFSIKFLDDDFELAFEHPVTIIVGENGTGKSTILEGIAALAGFDQAGGGKGYMPVDHSQAIETSGTVLGKALRASWLPRLSNGWFFRAESFFSVARYLDKVAQEPFGGPPPDFLSHSHGEGFLRFFEERCHRQGLVHLRRAGIGALAVTPDRVPEAAPAHGAVRNHPGHHGHACADADGLPRRAAPPAHERRPDADPRRGDGPLPPHARVQSRPAGVRRGETGGIVERLSAA
jgi:hypothetical protein